MSMDYDKALNVSHARILNLTKGEPTPNTSFVKIMGPFKAHKKSSLIRSEFLNVQYIEDKSHIDTEIDQLHRNIAVKAEINSLQTKRGTTHDECSYGMKNLIVVQTRRLPLVATACNLASGPQDLTSHFNLFHERILSIFAPTFMALTSSSGVMSTVLYEAPAIVTRASSPTSTGIFTALVPANALQIMALTSSSGVMSMVLYKAPAIVTRASSPTSTGMFTALVPANALQIMALTRLSGETSMALYKAPAAVARASTPTGAVDTVCISAFALKIMALTSSSGVMSMVLYEAPAIVTRASSPTSTPLFTALVTANSAPSVARNPERIALSGYYN
jgi:hypothetical protein